MPSDYTWPFCSYFVNIIIAKTNAVDSQFLICRLSLVIQFLSLNYGVLLTEGWSLDHLRIDILKGAKVCVCVCVCENMHTYLCYKIKCFISLPP